MEQALCASPPLHLPSIVQVHEARSALATFLHFVEIQNANFLALEESLLVGKMMEVLGMRMPCFEGT